MSEFTSETYEYEAPAEKKDNTVLIIVIVAVVLLLCCCCMALVGVFAAYGEEIMRELGQTLPLLLMG